MGKGRHFPASSLPALFAMKNKLFLVFAVLGILGIATVWPAAPQIKLVNSLPPPFTPPPVAATQNVSAQLQTLQAKVQARMAVAIKKGPEAFVPRAWADIIQAYDAILTAHKNEKTDDVAQVALAKALLNAGIYRPGPPYEGIFHQWDICIAQLQQVAEDYPGTPTAKQAAQFAQDFQEDAEQVAARRQLIGQPLPDFHLADYEGKPLSPSGFKGQVVFVDFWGTGCVPCLEEMSTVAKLYAQYHGKGFEVLGVCWATNFGLLRGADIKTNLAAFLTDYNMTWPEFCAGGPSGGPDGTQTNELFDKLRVTGGGIPANYLVGRDGKIIGMDLHGDDLGEAVAKALAAK